MLLEQIDIQIEKNKPQLNLTPYKKINSKYIIRDPKAKHKI